MMQDTIIEPASSRVRRSPGSALLTKGTAS